VKSVTEGECPELGESSGKLKPSEEEANANESIKKGGSECWEKREWFREWVD
jgi:hypothetical protein